MFPYSAPAAGQAHQCQIVPESAGRTVKQRRRRQQQQQRQPSCWGLTFTSPNLTAPDSEMVVRCCSWANPAFLVQDMVGPSTFRCGRIWAGSLAGSRGKNNAFSGCWQALMCPGRGTKSEDTCFFLWERRELRGMGGLHKEKDKKTPTCSRVTFGPTAAEPVPFMAFSEQSEGYGQGVK